MRKERFIMRAMILDAPGKLLRLAEVPVPEPDRNQVLIRVGPVEFAEPICTS